MDDQEAENNCPNKNPRSLAQLLDLTQAPDLEPMVAGKAGFPEGKTYGRKL